MQSVSLLVRIGLIGISILVLLEFGVRPFIMHQSLKAKLTRPEHAKNVAINTPRDPNTLSNYHNFVTTHTAVDFDIDFEKKRLHGDVVLTFKSITDAETDQIVLDTR